MDSVKSYIQSHRQAFEGDLADLLRIASVSADSRQRAETRRAADWVVKQFEQIGLATELIPTDGHRADLRRVAAGPRQTRRPGLRPLRRAAARAARRMDQPAVRADGARRQHLRPRCDRRQRPDAHARKERRSLDESGRQAAAASEVPDRRRRGSRQRAPGPVRESKSRQAGLRHGHHQRLQPVRPRHAGDHLRPARHRVLRAAAPRPQAGSALRHVRRRRHEPGQRAGRTARRAQRQKRPHPGARVLRRCFAAQRPRTRRVSLAAADRRRVHEVASA